MFSTRGAKGAVGRPYRVLSVFGTRPEAIKMAPLIKEIEKRKDLQSLVCVTAQHREMLDQVMRVFDLHVDYDLDIMSHEQTISSVTSDVVTELPRVFEEAQPDLILVHGDTTTSFAAALAGFYAQIPVGHVEAGLRTYNKYSPFPEEMNRTLTGKLADLHFAPTHEIKHSMALENIKTNVLVTGNTVIDSLYELVKPDYTFHNPTLSSIDFDAHRVILLTAHRRENLGEPLKEIFKAACEIVEENSDVLLVYPVHRNPKVAGPAHEILSGHPQIMLIDPLEVDDMHNLIDRSYLVMTDSGGLQEEAPSLGKPVVVLREDTERPEAVKMGTAILAGTNKQTIVDEVHRLLHDASAYERMANAVNPYGDGKASNRICDAIENYFETGYVYSGREIHEFSPDLVEHKPRILHMGEPDQHAADSPVRMGQ